MTPEDRHKRYFAPKNQLAKAELKALTHVDYSRSFAIAAVSRASDRFVGCGRFFSAGHASVEAAVVVLDSHKGSGLGSLLVDFLFRAAIEFGAKSLHIEHLATNGAVRRVFEKTASRHATGCTEGPLEDGICTVSWELKTAVDVPLDVAELKNSKYSVDAVERNFEVSRPTAHPLSLWRFELRMRLPHEGQMKTLSVRPVEPDDEDRERVFLRALGKEFDDLHVPCPSGSSPEGHNGNPNSHPHTQNGDASRYAWALTHYDFENGFAVAAVDERLDSIVGIARWAGVLQTDDANASLAVLDSWKGMGVGSFLFDVVVQSAIQEGRKRLKLQAPRVVVEVARRIVARHAVEVACAQPPAGQEGLVVEARLKPTVDRPTVVTRLPGSGLPASTQPGLPCSGGLAFGVVESKVDSAKTNSEAVESSKDEQQSEVDEDEADMWGY